MNNHYPEKQEDAERTDYIFRVYVLYLLAITY